MRLKAIRLSEALRAPMVTPAATLCCSCWCHCHCNTIATSSPTGDDELV